MFELPIHRRRVIQRLAALAAIGAGSRGAGARSTAPLRVLCTGPGGSIPDIIARRYADALGRRPGGALVENRPGAAGRLAVAALKQSRPDGATLLLAQGAVAVVYPYLYDELAYDPGADLKPVSLAAETALGFAVGPAVPERVSSIGAFIEWTRAHPAQANYGSPGVGTLPHLLSALLAREAKQAWQHVAYAGGPAALADLMGGRLAALTLPEGLLRQQHAAGKVRVLATSGDSRSEFMPAVPTFAEQGHPQLVVREWFAFFAHGATTPAAVDALSSEIRRHASSGTPAHAALREVAMVASGSTPAELAARIALEQKVWQRVIERTGVRGE